MLEFEANLGNSYINIQQHLQANDKGGVFEYAKKNHKYIHNGVEYKYKATGLQRICYESPCGTWVIKIPKSNESVIEDGKFEMLDLNLTQNIHDYLAYIEAPELIKQHIAKCEILPNGALLQERLDVVAILGRYREIGYDAGSKTYKVFDSDCFLDMCLQKPLQGYAYHKIFIELQHLFDADVVNFAKKYSTKFF